MDVRNVKRDFWTRLAKAAGVRPRLTVGALMIPLPPRPSDGFTKRHARVSLDWYLLSQQQLDSGVLRIVVDLNGLGGSRDLKLSLMSWEVPDWAEWVAAWIKARTGQADTVPAPPTRLHGSYSADDLVQTTVYLWTEEAERIYAWALPAAKPAADAQAVWGPTGAALVKTQPTPPRNTPAAHTRSLGGSGGQPGGRPARGLRRVVAECMARARSPEG
ncbi:MAG: hypothetical protein IMZ66_13295 [Planctomycetes bacterium]|nr:hypothetical protein [Planctomycetota bacterium]